ncbi:MAG TPA: hypothetical protein DCY88_18285 [Cyanobacteria bacterium UBA11372]|nr:hypothetical protein [Cyanobacteria bacterium UBA11372]
MTKNPKQMINATLKMSPEDWEAFKQTAAQMGLTRTQLLIQIANRKITMNPQEKMILGEY